MRIRTFTLAVGLAVSACSSVPPFPCDDDDQCHVAERDGVCTIYGHCAFADSTCEEFELRYHLSAGELAGTCVGDEGDFDPPGECEPAPEYCGDDQDSDCFEDEDPSCPAGDAPSTAVALAAGDDAYVNIRYADNEYTPSCASPGGRDAFFEFTLASDELVYLDTAGTDFRAVLVLRNGACAEQDVNTPELACISSSCSNRLSQWAGVLVAGTYCVVVDQYDLDEASFGSWNLFLRRRGGPAAAHLEVGRMSGDTCPSGSGVDGWSATCSQAGAADATYYFTLCEETATFAASTCADAGFSPVLHAHDGSGREAACAAGCTGGDGGLVAQLTGPDLFYLVVDGAGAADCGQYTLDASY